MTLFHPEPETHLSIGSMLMLHLFHRERSSLSLASGKCLRKDSGLGLAAALILALSLSVAGTARATQDAPFDMSANWGGTGLMEIPTARILPDGSMRLGVAGADPYIWYTFGFGVLPGMEFTARYTDVTNVPSGLGDDFGSYKDKAYDLKYQLLPESKAGPAIAIGLSDFNGTRIFEAQYLVISRQLYPLDITVGVGRKRLKGPLSIGDEIGFWGGVEWAVTDRLHAMIEYNPIEYEKDARPARGLPDGADFPVNIGLRYRTRFGFDLGLSCQRGDTLSMAVHLQFGLGRPILPPEPDPPSWKFVERPDEARLEARQRLQRLSDAIESAGFTDVTTVLTHGEMIAEFENSRYPADAQAAGRVLRLLLHAAVEADRLTVVMKRNGLKIIEISTEAEALRSYLMGNISPAHFKNRLSIVDRASHDKNRPAPTGETIGTALRHQSDRDALAYGIDPAVDTFFNDPSGVYQARLSLIPYATYDVWSGAALHASYVLPLYSDVESETSPPPDAVRSDSWKYIGSQSAVNRLLFDQLIKPAPMTYARFSAGYLERMYAGVGAEILTYLDRGRWGIGAEGTWARKREPDDPFGLTGQKDYTLLGNLYYRYLPLDITLKTQVGRFLAGDTGVRLEYRRRFDTGAEIGFWYSITDTDDLSGFNKDYNDQGIFLNLPFATFTKSPTRRMLNYSISPWTRDVGATIDHWRNIYDTTSDLTPVYIERHLDRLDD